MGDGHGKRLAQAHPSQLERDRIDYHRHGCSRCTVTFLGMS